MATVEAAPSPTVVRPRYLARFRCLGSDCPDDCCHGWGVEVDRTTRRQWERHPDPAWRTRLRQAIRRHPGGKVKLRLERNGRCPFLAEDGLCEVHRRLGHEALPLTCRTFPRRHTTLGQGVVLEAATLACPEIARILIEDPAALVDEERPVPLLPADPPGSLAHGFAALDRLLLRDLVLRILSAHQRPWPARLALLRIAVDDMVAAFRAGRPLVAVAEAVEAVLATPALEELAPPPPAEDEVVLLQMPLVRAFLAQVTRGAALDPQRAGLLVTTLVRLRESGLTPRELSARARAGEGACVRPLFAQHPHLPGNLLGGLLLQGGLPPEDPTALERCLWHAAYGFALWRFLLALEPDDEETALRRRAVTLAYQLARYLFHNRRWLEELHRHYETAGLCRAPLWFALLR